MLLLIKHVDIVSLMLLLIEHVDINSISVTINRIYYYK